MKKQTYVFLILSAFFISCFVFNSCEENPMQAKIKVGTWQVVEYSDSSILYDVDLEDGLYGWVVGDNGVILYSSDGGYSWSKQISPIKEKFWAVDFVDNKNGWICGTNSILKTTNGGNSWEIKYSIELGLGRFHDIQFLDKNNGFVVGGRGHLGREGILLKTEDGGETWKDVTPESLSTLTHISVVDKQNIWVCGIGGIILSTNDIGLTWTINKLNVIGVSHLTCIQFVDQYHGWVGGNHNDLIVLLKTTDGGNTWSKGNNESYCTFLGVNSFYFVDLFYGWLAPAQGGGRYSIFKTTDGGLTWESLPEDINVTDITSLCFISKDMGLAVGIKAVNANPQGIILLYRDNQ